MNLFEIRIGAMFKLENQIYSIENIEDENLICVNENLFSKYIPLEEFNTMFQQGEIDIFPNIINEQTSFENEHMISDIARFRHYVISPLLKHDRISEEMLLDRINDVNALVHYDKTKRLLLTNSLYYRQVSKASIYRWIKSYKEGGYEISSLNNNYTKNKESKLLPHVNDVIDSSLNEYYLKPNQRSIKSLYETIIYTLHQSGIGHEDFPSYETVRKRARSIPDYVSVSKRKSVRDAKIKYGSVGAGVQTSFPLERVEIDTKKMDILITEKDKILGRPILVAAIDHYTKVILGICISMDTAPGWKHVRECLIMMMSNKSYLNDEYPELINKWSPMGIPQTIVIDNGKEFKNKSFKSVACELGIILQYNPPRTPEMKGTIERVFRTFDTNLVHQMPGTTRSSPQHLSENENPANTAKIPFALFKKSIVRWIVDVYHKELHTTIKSTPLDLWNESIKYRPIILPSSSINMKLLLGISEAKTIQRYGIQINNLRYQSQQLIELYKKFQPINKGYSRKFQIKVDPNNLDSILVYDDLLNKRWIEVKSIDHEYTKNLTLVEHTMYQEIYSNKMTMDERLQVIAVKKSIEQAISDTPELKDFKVKMQKDKFLNLGKENHKKTVTEEDEENISKFLESSSIITKWNSENMSQESKKNKSVDDFLNSSSILNENIEGEKNDENK